MVFNVPQFIDIEDKIVGPLTAKQLGWLALGGVILLILYAVLDQSAFYIALFIIGPISAALAFYRPYGQPLSNFIGSSVLFFVKPKTYAWRRVEPKNPVKINHSKAPETKRAEKVLNREQLSELSKILDTQKK